MPPVEFKPIECKKKIYAISNKLGGQCQTCFTSHTYIAFIEGHPVYKTHETIKGSYAFITKFFDPQWGEIVEYKPEEDDFLSDDTG